MSTVTKQTHTPGPWTAQHTAGHATHGQSVIYPEAEGGDIAIVYDGDANAALIAAAPEMLAALELLLSEMKEGKDSPSLGAMQQVYAAVCKAKGEV